MVKRISSKQIKRKLDLFKFFEDNKVVWSKRFRFTSDYDLHFLHIKTPQKIGRFYKRHRKIAEMYIDEEISYVTIEVWDVEYEQYLYDLLLKFDTRFHTVGRASINIGRKA